MKYFAPIIALLYVLTFAAGESYACRCFGPPTVLDEFTRSDIVMTARLDGVEQVHHSVDGVNFYPTHNAQLTVEKVYKGSLKVGDEIRVRSGGGGDCSYGFLTEKPGQRFLLFTSDPRLESNAEKKPSPDTVVYPVSTCSRSHRVEAAARDLYFLDNIATLAGKTRLSGTITRTAQPDPGPVGVTIRGKGADRSTKTDGDGYFEFWGLPAGDYVLSVDLPPGAKLNSYRITPGKTFPTDPRPDGTISVAIVPRKHAELRAWFY